MSTKKKIKIPRSPHPEAAPRGECSSAALLPQLCGSVWFGLFYAMEMMHCIFNMYFEVSDQSQVWG